jgi:hypothetical protein
MLPRLHAPLHASRGHAELLILARQTVQRARMQICRCIMHLHSRMACITGAQLLRERPSCMQIAVHAS